MKLLDLESYIVRLKLNFKTDGLFLQFNYKGSFDFIFNSKLEIKDVPFRIDAISGKPQLEFYYDQDSKYDRHFAIIEKTFYPFLAQLINDIFKNEIEVFENVIKNKYGAEDFEDMLKNKCGKYYIKGKWGEQYSPIFTNPEVE